MLSIKNLSVNYGSISALRDENIEVQSGELVTLIGGNGAGKTSTLMAISNLVPKSGGTITLKARILRTSLPIKS